MRWYNKFLFFFVLFFIVFSIHALTIVCAVDTTINTTNNTTNTTNYNLTGLANSDWPSFANDNNHTGQSYSIGPQTNSTIWIYDNITVYGSAVIGNDGTIYIGGNNGKLYVFNSVGTLKWIYTTRSPILSSPTIGSDGTIYVSNWMNSTIYALNPNGTLQWKYTTGNYNFGSSPVMGTDGTIYIPTTNSTMGILFALKASGQVKWTYNMGSIFGTSPVIGTDGTIYMADYDGVLYAINPDGTIKWFQTLKYSENGVNYNVNIYYNTPSWGGNGIVYITSHNGRLITKSVNQTKQDKCVIFAVTDTGTSGTIQWAHNLGETLYGVPTTSSDGTIYVVGASKLYALNSEGNILWTYSTGGSAGNGITSAVIGSDETIYIGSSKGLQALNGNGTLKWKYSTGSIVGSPSIGNNGTMYIGTINGTFYAFNDISTYFTVENVKDTALTVQFTQNSAEDVKSWTWDLGDGNTSTAYSPQHTYSKAGDYTITLTLTLKNGTIIPITKTVTIAEKDITPPIIGTSLSSGTYNNTQNVSLTASDNRGNVTIYYTLDGSDPKTSSTRNVFTNPFLINDSLTLNFAALDSSGNWSPTQTEEYTIINVIYVQNASYYGKTLNYDIQSIFDSAPPGSIIIFKGQSYENLKLVINKKLDLISNIGTIIALNNSFNSPIFLLNGITASGTQIYGFTLVNELGPGIILNNVSNVTISNVKVTSTGGTAIHVVESVKTTIKYSSFMDSSVGFQLQNSINTLLEKNTIKNNYNGGVILENSTDTSINSGSISNNGGNGIKIYQSSYTNITGTTITGNGKTGDGSGVYTENSDNTKLIDSQITANWYGINTRNINGAEIGYNTISDNTRDGIILNGKIINTTIYSNTISGNNNCIHINGPDENLTIRENLMINSKEAEGVDRCYSGDGLLFGSNSIYSTSLVVTHNIIHENQHRDVESRYGSEDIDDIQGSNWSACGCGAPSHDLCGPDCQCKKWDPEMKMVLSRTGKGTFTMNFYDGKTGQLVTGIPSFDVIFAMNGASQTVKTANAIASITYDMTELIGMVTVSAFEHSSSVSWDTPVTGSVAYGDIKEGLTVVDGSGSGSQSHGGGAGTGYSNGQGSESSSGVFGSSSNNGVSSGTTPLGSAAELVSASGSTSSQGESTRKNSHPKTVQELILDETAENSNVWGILTIILLIIAVIAAYYRNDIKFILIKSRK